VAGRGTQNSEEIDEELTELEVNLKRLRIEYERFFKGAMKREPQQLLGKVQKTISKLANDPPRRIALKFRFNSLVARFQSMRQLWGRTMREMEAGTYKPDQFRMKLHQQEDGVEQPAGAAAEAPATDTGAAAPKSGIDRLQQALMTARRKTGEHASVDRDKLQQMIRHQTRAIRQKFGSDASVNFQVVVEGGRAKLRANVKRRQG
jgi:hypothetical protein